MNKEKITNIAKTVLVTGALLGFVGVASATSTWTAPAGSPPSLNVDAPVNVGTTTQNKAGTLGVTGFANFGTSVLSGAVAIGTSPAGAGGSMLNVLGKTILNGTIQITGGTPGAGKVLTSDASGNASWTTPSTGGSGLTSVAHDGTLTGAGTTSSPLSVVGGGGGGGVSGSGTVGYLPKFTGSSAIGTSAAYDDGVGGIHMSQLWVGGLTPGVTGALVSSGGGTPGGEGHASWRTLQPVYNNCSGGTGKRDGNTLYMDNLAPGCTLFGYVISP